MKKLKFLNFFLILALLFSACHKKEVPEPEKLPEQQEVKASGVFVLCEGLKDMNNSTLAFCDFTNNKITNDIFLEANGRGLGDTGNDLQCYGSKLYCVVNISETVEIMSKNARSIRQISLSGRQPRRITFHEGNAFVCCYDGSVVKIDTNTLEISGMGQAGSNPDGICVANGKIYVANSGGLNYPNYGHSVSVFDPSSLQLLKEIEVIINPTHIKADNHGNVYVLSNGNYGLVTPNVPSALQRIDSQSDEVVQTYDFEISNFTICNDFLYFYFYDYNTHQSQIEVMDVLTENIVNNHFIKDDTQINTPYGIGVNPENGDVYISDAYQFSTNGDVYCFGADGHKKFSFETGMNPSKFVILP